MRLAFLFLIASIGGRAQNRFDPGYYVTQDFDTVHGLINRWTVDNDQNSIQFKSVHGREVFTYSASDLKSFVVSGTEVYQSFVVTSDRGNMVPGFYKLLLRGKVSLYYYQDKHFGRSGGDVFPLTPRKRKIEPPEPQPGPYDNSQFRGDVYKIDYSGLGWLKARMKDCPEMNSKLDSEYKGGKPRFMALFESYHKCIGSPVYKPKS